MVLWHRPGFQIRKRIRKQQECGGLALFSESWPQNHELLLHRRRYESEKWFCGTGPDFRFGNASGSSKSAGAWLCFQNHGLRIMSCCFTDAAMILKNDSVAPPGFQSWKRIRKRQECRSLALFSESWPQNHELLLHRRRYDSEK